MPLPFRQQFTVIRLNGWSAAQKFSFDGHVRGSATPNSRDIYSRMSIGIASAVVVLAFALVDSAAGLGYARLINGEFTNAGCDDQHRCCRPLFDIYQKMSLTFAPSANMTHWLFFNILGRGEAKREREKERWKKKNLRESRSVVIEKVKRENSPMRTGL